MNKRLPVQVDPFRFAERGAVIEGEIPVADLGRLSDSLAATSGSVAAVLTFARQERGIPTVTVEAKTELTLVCQTCLETYPHSVSIHSIIGLIEDEAQATRLPEEYEPYLVESGLLRPQDLVEDELILALPVIARHPQGSCPAEALLTATDDEDGEVAQGKTDNPFAVLAGLKRNNDA